MRKINDWKLIDEKNQEIAELKSMVDILQRAARQTDNQFRIHAKLDSDTKTILSCALNKTPAQCLQSVKADAVKAFGHEIGLYGSEYDDQEYIEVCRGSIKEHIERMYEGES